MSERNTQEIEDAGLEEATAADTLKPGAGSGGTESRAEMLSTFTSLLAQLGKEDLTDLFNRTLEQIGHEADEIPSGAAEKNKASISVKEDISDMFSGDDLTEEFKEKAETIFEAALNTRITLETARLEEEFEAAALELEEEYAERLQEQADEMFEEVTDKLDQYLDYVVERWLEENEVAIETSLRAEIAEDFIAGLHSLFTEHHITVPESKVDLVAELKAELEEVKEALNTSLDEKMELESIIEEANKEMAFEEVAEGLAATQVEKLRTLTESVEFTDVESYVKKLNIVKENYFNEGRKAPAGSGFITEEIDGEDLDAIKEEYVPDNMKQYVNTISKIVK